MAKNNKYVITFEQYVAQEDNNVNESVVGTVAKGAAAAAIVGTALGVAGIALLVKKLASIGKKKKIINALIADEKDPKERDALKKQLRLLSTNELKIRAAIKARKVADKLKESEVSEGILRTAAIGSAVVGGAALVGGVMGVRALMNIGKKKKYITALIAKEQDPAKRLQLKQQLQMLSRKELKMKATAQARRSEIKESEIGKSRFASNVVRVGVLSLAARYLLKSRKRKKYIRALLANEEDPFKRAALKDKLKAMSTQELKYKQLDQQAKMR